MKLDKKTARQKKKYRIRKKISGTFLCPRLSVFKSNSNFYAQIIDDDTGRTLASESTLKIKDLESKSNTEAVKVVARNLAKKLNDKKIVNVLFDRNGYIYHGKIKIFAEILREEGIKL